MTPDAAPLLRVQDLVVEYPRSRWRGRAFRALDAVSVGLHEGETVGLVGESGAGKSTLARAVLGLAPITSGSIVFDGVEISGLTRAQRRSSDLGIQAVFQDPYRSLNPAMTVEQTLAEPLLARGRATRPEWSRRVRELLDQVHLPAVAAGRLPRDFSGGQRQRIAIARALAVTPRLIVCDEPLSALDLLTQEQIRELFIEIQEQTGVGFLFISHDLSMVRRISHRVAVLRAGEIVESGDAEVVTTTPAHPYTRRLLMAAPVPDPPVQRQRRERRHAMERADLIGGLGVRAPIAQPPEESEGRRLSSGA